MKLNDDLILEFEEKDLDTTHIQDLRQSFCGLDSVTYGPKSISLARANALLKEEMTMWLLCKGTKYGNAKGWAFDQQGILKNQTTHWTRIVPPKLLKKETAEDVLREYVNTYRDWSLPESQREFINRAISVLGME